MISRVLSGLVALVLITGCAGNPVFEPGKFDDSVDPSNAVTQFEQYRGKLVLLGGRLVETVNLEDGTQLEVTGYPLRKNRVPHIDVESTGRFIVLTDGFLEPVDFAPGRLITVGGRLDGIQQGRIGEVRYQYPVIEAEQIQLWNTDGVFSKPRVHFGVGFIFSN